MEIGGDCGGLDGWKQGNIIAQAGFHRAMLRWLETGEEVGTSLSSSLHEWAVVLAMYQSAMTRKPVDMEGFHPDSDLVEALEKTLRQ